MSSVALVLILPFGYVRPVRIVELDTPNQVVGTSDPDSNLSDRFIYVNVSCVVLGVLSVALVCPALHAVSEVHLQFGKGGVTHHFNFLQLDSPFDWEPLDVLRSRELEVRLYFRITHQWQLHELGLETRLGHPHFLRDLQLD